MKEAEAGNFLSDPHVTPKAPKSLKSWARLRSPNLPSEVQLKLVSLGTLFPVNFTPKT